MGLPLSGLFFGTISSARRSGRKEDQIYEKKQENKLLMKIRRDLRFPIRDTNPPAPAGRWCVDFTLTSRFANSERVSEMLFIVSVTITFEETVL